MSTKRAVLVAAKDCRQFSSNFNQQNYGISNGFQDCNQQQQYNSINLNKYGTDSYPVHFNSNKTSNNYQNKNALNNPVDYIIHQNNYETRKDATNSWKKNDFSKSDLCLQNYHQEQWKKKKNVVEKLSNSTLSLHIAAYENGAIKSKDVNDIQKLDPFAFTRQQKEEELMEAEVMAFKLSNRMMNLYGMKNTITIIRNIRRRTQFPPDFLPSSLQKTRPKEADFLKDATTYSDVHSAIIDPHSSLPYPPEQLQDYLHGKEKEEHQQKISIKSHESKKGRKIIKLNFDHIPIEDQVVALFPGQGAQHVKMGEKVIDCSSSKALFDQANEILGYDLLKLCMEGPKTKLDQTIYCQPAVFVASLAAYEKLKAEQPDLEDRLTDAAGFSVGEYAALVAGGVMKFEDALKVVKIRAEAMHECNQIVQAGMLTIRVNASSKLEEALKAACEDAMEANEVPCCEVANYLFQGVKVIGGTNRCLTYLESNASRFNIQPLKRLAVSGAFHTRLMSSAMEPLQRAFTGMQFEPASCNIYSNYSGKIHSRKAGEIRKALIQQVAEPVKWEQIQQLLFRKHQNFKFPNYIEIGPGRQLGSMLVNISKKAYQSYTNFPC